MDSAFIEISIVFDGVVRCWADSVKNSIVVQVYIIEKMNDAEVRMCTGIDCEMCECVRCFVCFIFDHFDNMVQLIIRNFIRAKEIFSLNLKCFLFSFFFLCFVMNVEMGISLVQIQSIYFIVIISSSVVALDVEFIEIYLSLRNVCCPAREKLTTKKIIIMNSCLSGRMGLCMYLVDFIERFQFCNRSKSCPLIRIVQCLIK